MNRLNPSKLRLRISAALVAIIAGICAASVSEPLAAEPDKDAKTDAKPAKKAEAKTEKKAEKKKLTGSELFAIHCNRCHPERYPTEFNARQWKTIMQEMRVRANLPADQAKAILKYLLEDSGKP